MRPQIVSFVAGETFRPQGFCGLSAGGLVKSFLNLFLITCLCECMFCACRCQRRSKVSDSLKPELQVVLSHLLVLGIKLWSSGRTICALHR